MNTISRINPFTMGFIKYNRDQLLKLLAGRPSIQNKKTIENLKQFNLFHYRGARGGVDRGLRTWDRNDGVNQINLKSLPEAISTVNLTSRPPPSKENGLKTSEFLNDDWPKFLA